MGITLKSTLQIIISFQVCFITTSFSATCVKGFETLEVRRSYLEPMDDVEQEAKRLATEIAWAIESRIKELDNEETVVVKLTGFPSTNQMARNRSELDEGANLLKAKLPMMIINRLGELGIQAEVTSSEGQILRNRDTEVVVRQSLDNDRDNFVKIEFPYYWKLEIRSVFTFWIKKGPAYREFP